MGVDMSQFCQTAERDAMLAQQGHGAHPPERLAPAFRTPGSESASERSASRTSSSTKTDSATQVLEDVAAAQIMNSRPVDLSGLLNRCLGNVGLVERVMNKFRETGGTDLNHLEQALDNSDLQQVVEITHRFKGAASNISAARLHELAARAERMGRERDSVALKDVLAQLRIEWRKFTSFSETFLSTAAVASGPGTNSL
jgi:HPt (histidine-containing phosphotransfer) domain-containing protein